MTRNMNNKRKIVQIAATADPGATSDLLYALCDDGTLWWIEPQLRGDKDIWRKVRDVPQEENNHD